VTAGFPVRFLDQTAQQAGPTVPQWVATVILFAALAGVVALFVFVLKTILKNQKKR